MNSKAKNILIVVLVLLNLATTIGILWHERANNAGHPHTELSDGAPSKDLLADELGFDAEQREQLDRLKREHRQSMESSQHELTEIRMQLHESIGAPNTTEEQVSELSDSIGGIMAKIERSVFDHFRDIRGLCTEKQAIQFDKVVFDLMRQMGPPSHGDGPPDGRRPPHGRP